MDVDFYKACDMTQQDIFQVWWMRDSDDNFVSREELLGWQTPHRHLLKTFLGVNKSLCTFEVCQVGAG